MICENCGMLTKPFNDGTCEFGDHKVSKQAALKDIERIVNAGLRRAFMNGATDHELTLELKHGETRPSIDEQVAHLQSDIMAKITKELT